MEHARSLQDKIDSLLDGQAGKELQLERNFPPFVVVFQLEYPSLHVPMIASHGKPGKRLCPPLPL